MAPVPAVSRIVLTGGPCAGKTTALSEIKDRLTALGVHVVTIPENATQVFENSGGYHPAWAAEQRRGHVVLQRALLRFQMDAEKNYLAIARLHAETRGTPAVLLCDRGVFDGKSFVQDAEWDEILGAEGLQEEALLERYDMVCHLVTAAKGAPEHYEWGPTSRNPSRFHNMEEAIEADQRGLDAWGGHRDLHVVTNETGFGRKVQRVLTLICTKLGLPRPYESTQRIELAPVGEGTFAAAGVLCRETDVTTYGSHEQWERKTPWKEELRKSQTVGGNDINYTLVTKKEVAGVTVRTCAQITAREFCSRIKVGGHY
jgi:hypothetical protein